MTITAKQYAIALFEAVAGAGEGKTKDIIKSFSWVLVKNNQSSQLGKIIGQFEQIWDKKNNITKAEFISALKLAPKTEKVIEQYLKKAAKGGEVKLSKKVDKSVLGGVIIKYGDKILDASLRARLGEFKNTIER